MSTTTSLSDRISVRLDQHNQELVNQQCLLDDRMQELLEQRERHMVAAKQRIETVVRPRMEELIRNFDNASLELFATDLECSCACEFKHVPRFPATVRLVIALYQGEDEKLIARYDLSIFPIFMEFTQAQKESFPIAACDGPLTSWVDDRILDFIDTYLRLETHPFYQKDNSVLDIVCGMHIPSVAAASTVECHGRIFYFCSEHCKEAFLKKSDA